MAEYRRPDRSTEKADEKDSERLQHADDRIRLRKEELTEDQSGHLAVKQKIVPFDRGADRAGDQGATQLRPVLGVRKRSDANFDCSHLGFPQSVFGCAIAPLAFFNSE